MLLDPGDTVQNALGVAMRRIDDNDIDTRLDECLDTFVRAFTDTHCSTGAQPLLAVAAGIRVVAGLLDILDSDEAAQLEVAVDDEHLLDAVLVQQCLDFLAAGALLDGHEFLFRGHDRADRLGRARLEAQVAASDDTDEIVAIDDGHAGDTVPAGQFENLADTGSRRHSDRVVNDTAFVLLDPADTGCLLFDAHVLMDDADATFEGHRDGKLGFGDRIHSRRDQGDVELNFARQTRRKGDILGQHARMGWHEQDIVKSQGFLGNSQHLSGSSATEK